MLSWHKPLDCRLFPVSGVDILKNHYQTAPISSTRYLQIARPLIAQKLRTPYAE